MSRPSISGSGRYGQGGTHTLQRNLIQVTGGGAARDFDDARDCAIIRILRSEGIRRAELLGMVMSTLRADVARNPLFGLVP